jgi:transcriptional regulator of acetoin/glycerol metabolism/AraC-like DNA-binding protein
MNTVAQLRTVSSNVDVSHEERIELVADGASEGFHPEAIDDSWRRCLRDFRVDPNSGSIPHLLSERELRISREPLRNFLLQAQEEIDRLYAIVRPQSYVVLLCNSDGVAIHHRGDENKDHEFKQWGIWLGGVWSERVEGTNGIGTCITDRRPVLVHCAGHFRSRHTRLSCAGAPIFDPQGDLLAVLDVSKVHQQSNDQPFPLLLQTVVVSARAIEERIFREHFQHCWILAAAPSDDLGASLLLAIDDQQSIIGGDQAARKFFALSDKSLADGIPLSAAFAYDRSLFRRTADEDIPIHLMSALADGRRWSALFTPPLSRPKVARSWAEAVVHSRPRISTLGDLRVATAAEPSRGGLSPAVTRRICDYIEGHLDEKIRLDGLAALAGLSTDHFARAFHQSVGVPPHTYLLRRRLEEVEYMLRKTHAPLSEIALATGFSDQSHLARHFRRWAGMSPRQVRWSEGNPLPTT